MELAKCLNFTKAAMNLYIAQPALSQQIADLEKQLGVTLFIRNSRSVALTPAGQVLHDSCPDIFRKLDNVSQQMRMAQAGLKGSLKIGFLDSFRAVLPPILAEFAAQYPDVRTQLFHCNPQELKTALDEGHVDLAFSFINERYMGIESPNYSILYKDHMYLAVQKDHPFVTKGGTNYALLDGQTLFCLDSDTNPKFQIMVHNISAELDLHDIRYQDTNSLTTMLLQVDAGLGFAIVPGRQAGILHGNVSFIPLRGKVIDFGVLWLEHNQNAALPLFLDTLEKHFEAKKK